VTVTDAALIQACIAGDREAWETLVLRYERIVYALARELCPQRDDAEAVFCRVWLELFQHLEEVQDCDIRNRLVVVTSRKCFPIYEARKDAEAMSRHYRVIFSCLPKMLDQHIQEQETTLGDRPPAPNLWNLRSAPDPAIQAAFALLHDEPSRSGLPEILAATIFDTRIESAVSGFRGGSALRQLTMQAGNIDIHLSISAARVNGQVMLRRGEKLPGRSAVTLTRGHVVQQTRTNHFGEFEFGAASKGKWTMTAVVPSEACRVVGCFEIP
jgi:DNA-directed RNA polymerase specialized sigma24 family protein